MSARASRLPRSRRRVSIPSLILIAALVAAAVALALSVVIRPPAPRTLDEQAHAVAATLRCPVCLNLSVADSPSAVAQGMRSKIRRELAAGESPSAIRAEFVAAYGDWILLSPRPSGLNLLAWILPGVVLLLGLVIAGYTLRRWTRTPSPSRTGPRWRPPPTVDPLSDEDHHRVEQALAALGDDPS